MLCLRVGSGLNLLSYVDGTEFEATTSLLRFRDNTLDKKCYNNRTIEEGTLWPPMAPAAVRETTKERFKPQR